MNAVFVEAVQRLMLGFGETLPKHGPDAAWGAESQDAFNRLIGLSVPAPVVSSPEIPDDYFAMLSKIESGDRPYVKAGTSSASGLYQFIKATWRDEGGSWGNDSTQAFGGLKPSLDEQLARAKTFTAKNARILSSAGIPINKASLYAAHFLGVGTAIKALRGDVKDRVDAHVGRDAIEANPSILVGTVGNFLSWLQRKTGAWAK